MSNEIERLEGTQLRSLKALRVAALVLEGTMNDLLTVGPADGRGSDEVEEAKSRTWEPVDQFLKRTETILALIREEVWGPPKENLRKMVCDLDTAIKELEDRDRTKSRPDLKAALEKASLRPESPGQAIQ